MQLSSPRIENVCYQEVNSFADSLCAWPQEYDQVSCGRFEGHLQDVELAEVRLFRETMNLSVAQHTHTPAGRISVLIPLRIENNGTSDQARCISGKGVTLLPYNSDFFFVGPDNTDYIVVSVEQQQLQALLSDDDLTDLLQAQRSFEVRVKPDDLRQLQRHCRLLLDNLLRLQQQPTRHGETSEQALIRQTAERQMSHQLIGLVVELFARSLKRDSRPLGNQHHFLVRQSHEFVLSEAGSNASVLEVCKHLNVPQRTLSYSFEKVAGCSPAQYLRAARLNGVRRELISSDLPIGAVAANYGFFHPGYFGQEYRRLFGETPSQTRQSCLRQAF
ncbi:helix-turn-helix domain-containing protein [Oceanobacter mangrovi]|uniref:helix-turn-helix domain-containing protein n=1 Tax=Oceanobacter mangrovi TaxID=2862510 RepID=UPI001C8F0AF5|nr:helix-turn-helix domain-containing protein [Oceanobacter mangrovi]